MLERDEGASIVEIMVATGWLAHTVRGAIAGALKKRLGLNVSSDTEEGRGRCIGSRAEHSWAATDRLAPSMASRLSLASTPT